MNLKILIRTCAYITLCFCLFLPGDACQMWLYRNFPKNCFCWPQWCQQKIKATGKTSSQICKLSEKFDKNQSNSPCWCHSLFSWQNMLCIIPCLRCSGTLSAVTDHIMICDWHFFLAKSKNCYDTCPGLKSDTLKTYLLIKELPQNLENFIVHLKK